MFCYKWSRLTVNLGSSDVDPQHRYNTSVYTWAYSLADPGGVRTPVNISLEKHWFDITRTGPKKQLPHHPHVKSWIRYYIWREFLIYSYFIPKYYLLSMWYILKFNANKTIRMNNNIYIWYWNALSAQWGANTL